MWLKINQLKIKAWNESRTYQLNRIVYFNFQHFIANQKNKSKQPDQSQAWTAVDLSFLLSNEDKIKRLQALNKLPTLEREAGLVGIDSDQNGIRDDIDHFIDTRYLEETQRKAARQLAKALQLSLLVNTSDIILVKKVNIKISRGDSCVFNTFDFSSPATPPGRVSAQIEAITTNTKERLIAYLRFNKALDGTSWSLPKENYCE